MADQNNDRRNEADRPAGTTNAADGGVAKTIGTVGGAAVGAAVGSVLGPIGTIAGGIAGGMLGNRVDEDTLHNLGAGATNEEGAKIRNEHDRLSE